jgi:hypothetical protein
MDIALELIDSMIPKFRSEMRGILKVIEQLDEEDIVWAPNIESNSIANLVAHIRGCVHSRIEQILYGIPDTRDRDKEFERGLRMTKEEAYRKARESFEIILEYLEHLKANPHLLMSRPFLNLPPLTYSQVGNDTTALNLMIAMVREIHYHTGQIVYIAKIRKGKIAWD